MAGNEADALPVPPAIPAVGQEEDPEGVRGENAAAAEASGPPLIPYARSSGASSHRSEMMSRVMFTSLHFKHLKFTETCTEFAPPPLYAHSITVAHDSMGTIPCAVPSSESRDGDAVAAASAMGTSSGSSSSSMRRRGTVLAIACLRARARHTESGSPVL